MTEQEIRSRLLALRDQPYADFQRKLIPNVPPESIIGVRTPELRTLAKEMIRSGEAVSFLAALPHASFDENQLHAFILSEEKDFDACVRHVQAFLPFVDNWATCDQLSPKVFKKHQKALLPYLDAWMRDERTYTVRFALGMLMQHYLDDAFDPAYLEQAASIRSEEYYVNMMVAWYFATALAKQFDAAFPYIQKERLAPWTRGKTIQKALESRRLTDQQKDMLRACRKKANL